ncbi:hypothetical protein IAQ61_008074 [Plenodomus lingam]|uniref:uncharacterized protein n=1 Tax=Leptosphaeria maculans TaxID=5022 RepID=UPI00331AD960|nr:hypothetical protein IAQ61_008074 [Plenodomus lingam]
MSKNIEPARIRAKVTSAAFQSLLLIHIVAVSLGPGCILAPKLLVVGVNGFEAGTTDEALFVRDDGLGALVALE